MSESKVANRSMLHRIHQQHEGQFESASNQVLSFKETEQEKQSFKNLALIDLTVQERVGFKGKDTPDWLQQQKVQLPEQPNTAIRLSDQTLVAKLSTNEFLFLDALTGPGKTVAQLKQWQFKDNHLCYLLPRQHSHSWFLLTGAHACEMLAKVCGIDFRDKNFALHNVAQTSLARITAIIIKDEISGVEAFHILSDSASAEYLWGCLLDAMREFDGQSVGLNVIKN